MKHSFWPLVFRLMAAAHATAGEAVTYPFEGSFERRHLRRRERDPRPGLVIDYTSHVGDMLNRTGADVGSDVRIFDAADIFIFCSAHPLARGDGGRPDRTSRIAPMASLSPSGMARSRSAIATMPEGEMQKVQALLDEIVQDGAGVAPAGPRLAGALEPKSRHARAVTGA